MATRQIVADAFELNILLLGTLNLASMSLQSGDMHATQHAIARAAELSIALKEAIAAQKPANGAAEGKRA